MEELSRILCLRLQRKTYDTEIVQRYISYKGSQHNLSEDEYNNLLSIIPDIWNTEKDQLTYFCLHPDKTFLCTRIKEVYNFSIKETEKKTYDFNGVTDDQLNEFVSILTDFYTKVSTSKFNNTIDDVFAKVYDMSYLKYSLLEAREESLKETDYMFNRDYVFKTVEEEEQWKKYRQEWRDITEQDSWKTSDYISVKIPVSPQPREQIKFLASNIGSYLTKVELPSSIEEEIVDGFEENFVELVENYSSIIVKIEIIKRILALNIPLGFNADELVNLPDFITYNEMQEITEDSSITSVSQEQYYNTYSDMLANKISQLDNKLKSYNFDFTVGDIIEKYLNYIKEKAANADKNEEAMRMLEDLQFEENGL